MTQVFYKRRDIYAGRPIVDDIVGGLLGLGEGLLLLLVITIILGSYAMPLPFQAEIGWIRTFHDMVINQSHILGAFKSNAAPVFLHILSPLLPSDLVRLFP